MEKVSKFKLVKNQIKINKIINPFKKKIYVPGDKSISIRCILLASIATGKSEIFNLLKSEDVLNAVNAVKKIGVNCIKKKNSFEVYGVGINGFHIKKNTTINAGNSGTLARCLLGLCSGIDKEIKIIGDKSLSKRDFLRVIKQLNLFGTKVVSKNGTMPLKIVGSNLLRPINYIEDKGSAQIKTCIILSAINTNGITNIKAKKSRNHTELILKNFNYPINIKKNKKYDLIKIRGLSQFNSFNYNVPGDISSAAFFIALTILSNDSNLLIKDVNINPSRTGIIKILKKMNAIIKISNRRTYKGEITGDIYIESSNNLKSINCDPKYNSEAIDEFLLIFLIAAKANGISKFKNLGELNKKESPRLDLSIKFLKMIGIKVYRNQDNIKIFGNPNLKLNNIYHIKNFLKDHRIFMMSIIAALTLGGTWTVDDKDSIKTSFPEFLKIIKKLGAKFS